MHSWFASIPPTVPCLYCCCFKPLLWVNAHTERWIGLLVWSGWWPNVSNAVWRRRCVCVALKQMAYIWRLELSRVVWNLFKLIGMKNVWITALHRKVCPQLLVQAMMSVLKLIHYFTFFPFLSSDDCGVTASVGITFGSLAALESFLYHPSRLSAQIVTLVFGEMPALARSQDFNS